MGSNPMGGAKVLQRPGLFRYIFPLLFPKRPSGLCRITVVYWGDPIRGDASMLKSSAAVAVFAFLLACAAGAEPKSPAAPDELVCVKVSKLPEIDGKAGDEAWKAAKEVVVKIDQPDEEMPKKTISIKAVHDGTSICMLFVWADADKNDQHSPLNWKGTAYEADDDKVEDACTVGFEMEGKFDSDMKAGIESKWDVWEWGAARTNSTGFAVDR